MRIGIQQIFPLVTLALMAAGTFWLERATQAPAEHATSTARHVPDLIVDDFTLRRFNAGGSLQYTLTGQEMRHFPDDDSSLVTTPLATLTDHGRPLTVEGDTGHVFQGGKKVILTGNVKAVRAPDADHPVMTYTSNSLILWPDDERAVTHDPLVLTQGATVIHARSMDASNIFGNLVLGGRVNAEIVRKH